MLIALFVSVAVASAGAPVANAGRTDIEKIVVRGTPEDQASLKGWLTEHAADPQSIERELLASGFRKEPARGNCFAYAYSGKDMGTRDDRTASVTYCDDKLVWVAIWTLLPVEKNPKGPLPVIKPVPASPAQQ